MSRLPARRGVATLLVAAAASVCLPALSAQGATTPVVERATSNVVVHWGTGVDAGQAAAVTGLLAAVDRSGYLSGLASAYGVTPSAAYAGAAVLPQDSLPSQVDTTTISQTVAAAVANGQLPAVPDAANYVVMLPPGVDLPNDGTTGQPPCAARAPFDAGNQRAHVIILTDYSGTVRQCGGVGSDATTAATVTLSRELVDTITDPEANGSGVTASGAPGAAPSTPVGDACASTGGLGNVDGWVVQSWWSNTASACTVGTVGVSVVGDVDPVTNVQEATFLLHDTEATSKQPAFSCSVDGAATSCGTGQALALSGVAAGSHTVAVQASGVGTATVTWLVDLTAPVASMRRPTAAVTVGKSVTVAFGGSDTGGAGVAAYDVRYRSAAWNGGFGRWVQPPAWQATTRTSVSVPVTAGRSYCFSVRAQDAAGNVQPSWSAPRCTAVPLDDRALALVRGWQRLTARSAFHATLTRGVVPGARLRLVRAHGDRVALLVRTCPTCGRLAVYRAGVLWRTVNTHSTKLHDRVLLTLPSFSMRTTTFWLQPVSARPVYVDGIAVEQV